MDRIASFEPDILLVEKSAARFTQDALLEKGIALVLNVKGSLLDRLARCSGAQASRSCQLAHLCQSACAMPAPLRVCQGCCSVQWQLK